MQYKIEITFDEEAGVWVAINDQLPLTAESLSFDALLEKVKIRAYEMLELNHSPTPIALNFVTNSVQTLVL